MACTRCGAPLNAELRFCPSCGAAGSDFLAPASSVAPRGLPPLGSDVGPRAFPGAQAEPLATARPGPLPTPPVRPPGVIGTSGTAVNGLALMGAIGGVLLPPLGAIVAIVSLGQIYRSQPRERGLGLAWFGLVAGVALTLFVLTSF